MFKKFLPLLLIMVGLFFTSVAVADIISGLSTTGISSDVTYTQLTLDEPDGVLTGDLLLANISVNGGAPAIVTPPSGWTLIAKSSNDTNIGIVSYWKIVGGSEPDSYMWNISPQTRAVGGITNYSDVDTSNPIDTVGSSTGRGTTATAPSITTSHDGDQVVALFASNFGTNNSAFFSTTTGMTKRYDAKNTPFGPTTAAEDMTQVSAGASGSSAVTISQGPQRDWVAQTIALRMSQSYDIVLGDPIDEPSINTIVSDQNWHAQYFTTVGAGNVTTLQICLNNNNSMAGTATIDIETDGGGAPSGTVVGGNVSFNLNTIPSGAALRTFTLSSPAALSASTNYWVVLKASSSMSGSGLTCGRSGSFSAPNYKYGNGVFFFNQLQYQLGTVISVSN